MQALMAMTYFFQIMLLLGIATGPALATGLSHLKEVTKVGEAITALAAFQNKLYFAGKDLYRLEPAKGEPKKIYKNIKASSMLRSISSKKLYITSKNGYLYEYYSENNGVQLVATANSSIGHSVEFGGKIYFGSVNGTLYEYDPNTGKTKIASEIGAKLNELTMLNNKVYVGATDYSLYEFDAATNAVKLVATALDDVAVLSSVEDKILFGSGKELYEFNPKDREMKSVCVLAGVLRSMSKIENYIYLGLESGQVYKYRAANRRCEKVIKTGGQVLAIASLNDKLYIATNNGHLYEYYEEINLEDAITFDYIHETINTNEGAILAELGYLNLRLNTALLEVTDITNSTAVIVAKNGNGKYFGEKIVYFTSLLQEGKKIYNFTELLKKGTVLTFQKKYIKENIKEIEDFNTNFVEYSNIKAKLCNEPIIESMDNKSICIANISTMHNKFDGNRNVMRMPGCSYKKEMTISTDITCGLYTELNFTASHPQRTWNDILGMWPFLDDNAIAAFGEDTFGISEVIHLTKEWDFSVEADEYGGTTDEYLPPNSFVVLPEKKMRFKVYVTVEFQQAKILLEQNFTGRVFATFRNINDDKINFSVTVTEVMKTLRDFELLPAELTIHDNNATFHGEIIRKMKRNSYAYIEYYLVSLLYTAHCNRTFIEISSEGGTKFIPVSV